MARRLWGRPGVSSPLWNEVGNADSGLGSLGSWENLELKGGTKESKIPQSSTETDRFVYFSHGGLSAVPAPKYNACFILLHY